MADSPAHTPAPSDASGVAGTRGVPRGPYRTGVRTRARVLEAAVEAFGRLGYRGATLQVIAEATGLTPSGITRLFGSKELLLRAAVDAWDESTSYSLVGDDTGLGHLRALTQLLVAHVGQRSMIELQARLLVEALDPDHPAHDQVMTRYRQVRRRIADQIRIAVDQDDLAPMTAAEALAEAHVLVAMLDGLQQQWLLDPAVDMAACFTIHLERWISAHRPRMNITPGS